MISIVIADDQPLVRSGLRMILEGEPDFTVVGEAADGAAAVELVAKVNPDVLLLDVQMPGSDGLDAMAAITEQAACTRVLMLTTFDSDEYVHRAMRAGAAGFLLKDMLGEEIVAAVRQAAQGVPVLLAPAVARRLIDRFTSGPVPTSVEHVDGLTPREIDVLRLVGRGLSNAEIARQLFIGESTVKTHVSRCLLKLGLRDRVQAAILAQERGLS